MDDMAAYYNPHPPPPPPAYYQQPPPPPYGGGPNSLAPPPPAQPQPLPPHLHQPYYPHSYHDEQYYPPPHPPPSSHVPPPPPHHWSYHQNALPLPPPPPPPSQLAYHHYNHNNQDDVRTLFIAGLPVDVEAREIYNLFREFPGYESSKLRRFTEHNQPYGFAVFRDQQSAVAAMHALNGLVFDLEKQSTLYINLAKSNSKSYSKLKRPRTDDGSAGSFDKKLRGPPAFSKGAYDAGVGGNIHLPGMGNSAYNTIGYSSTQSHGLESNAVNVADPEKMNAAAPHVPHNGTPCPTLFVANLAPTCAEQELIEVFSRCPGFLKLKIQNKNGAPVAFVDFQDVTCSTTALNNLQDTILYTSPDEGMRLEYAKSRMGKPKKPS